MSPKLPEIWSDLRRRRVFQVAAIYAALAWVVVQVASEFVPALFLPNWVMTALVTAVIIGFPIALILAWLFDVGPNGVVRTKPGSATGVLAIFASIALLVAGTAVFVVFIVPDTPQEVEVPDRNVQLPNSIAVLPFVNLSSNPEDLLGDGIADVLIHRLAQLQQLTVIARTSSFAFKGQNVDIREIGQILGVETILEGSVQRADGKLRIAAQLIDAHSGAHVWSRMFDRKEQDIFAIQDEISVAVAEAMVESLANNIQAQLVTQITENLNAYDFFLLGRHSLFSAAWDAGGQDSIDAFSRALEWDADFPLALSGLADSLLFHSLSGFMPVEEAVEKAREAIDKALSLDPMLGEAHASRILYAALTSDFELAESAFERSSKLSPNYWPQYLWFGNMLAGQDRLSDALDAYERGLRLQPYRPDPLLSSAAGQVLVLLGEYGRGMRNLVDVAERQRGSATEVQYSTDLARVALESGHFDEAVAFAQIAIADGIGREISVSNLAMAYLALGGTSNARTVLSSAAARISVEIDPDKPVTYSQVSVLYAWAHLHALQGQKAELAQLSMSLTEASAQWENPYIIYLAGKIALLAGDFSAAADLFNQLVESIVDMENYALAAYSSLRAGDEQNARRLLHDAKSSLEHAIREVPGSPVRSFYAAQLLAVANRAEEAMSMLEAAFESGYRDHKYLMVLPLFDGVRDDPRFVRLIEMMEAETSLMAKRVREANASGDWRSLVAYHYANATPPHTASAAKP